MTPREGLERLSCQRGVVRLWVCVSGFGFLWQWAALTVHLYPPLCPPPQCLAQRRACVLSKGQLPFSLLSAGGGGGLRGPLSISPGFSPYLLGAQPLLLDKAGG